MCARIMSGGEGSEKPILGCLLLTLIMCLSAVTGILQVSIGYIAADTYSWDMTKQLIHEAILVADAMGLNFNESVISERVRQTSIQSPDGLTSIYKDLKEGRRTEMNAISGSIVRAAQKPVLQHRHTNLLSI